MKFTINGDTMFDDFSELCYNLMMQIGLGINRDGYVYDQDTGITLKSRDKYLKASVDGSPIYTGSNDIAFDPVKNYVITLFMLGYYIDKMREMDGEDIGFISQGIEDNDDKSYHRAFIDCSKYGRIYSKFYHISSLGYVELIFKLGDMNTDISNFDLTEEEFVPYAKK